MRGSIKTSHRVLRIPLQEVACFESEERYVCQPTQPGTEYLAEYTWVALEAKPPDYYVRISRPVIADQLRVKGFYKYFAGPCGLILAEAVGSKLTGGLHVAERARKLPAL